ncbi:MAG TPA: hypothetical protein EYP88_08440 [Anaerolineales bacterium]|nr:hypothetical protein [Anaerolineales bacterium]
MPYGDGRGPRGEGPGTGRGLGYCSGNNRPGYVVPGAARGYGYGGRWGARGSGPGRGFGRGWGGRFANNWRGTNVPPVEASPAASDDINTLKAQADELRAMLAAIQNRLDALEK